jgi:hypothetical protein
MTTLGDFIYGGASGTGTRLAPNSTATLKFLSQTSSTPSWVTLSATDLPVVTFSPGAAGTYGSSTAVPVLTIDTYGRISGVTTASVSSLSGLTSYGVLYATSSTSATTTAVGSAGQPLLSGGAGTGPEYGTLDLSYGGTGQTTASAAFNALSPMTTLGDLIYGGASGSASRLVGNTTATKNFLVQTGNGTVSGAPSWGTIAAGDIPTLNQNTTGSAGSLSTIFTSGYVLYGQGTGVPAYSSGFYWDNSNGRLGIGTSSPQFRLNSAQDISLTTDIAPDSAQFAVMGATTNTKRMVFGYDTQSAGNGYGFIKAGNYNVAWTTISLQPTGGNVGIGITNPASYTLTVAGTIGSTGNITAFTSDKRLKKKTGPITDALDKVCRLEGFTYVHNDVAREHGFTDDRQYVGLSAQDLQAVLPEVVFPAPFDADNKSGHNFLTVQYERVVPLLVEALKEERSKREMLEERLAKLEKLVLQE